MGPTNRLASRCAVHFQDFVDKNHVMAVYRNESCYGSSQNEIWQAFRWQKKRGKLLYNVYYFTNMSVLTPNALDGQTRARVKFEFGAKIMQILPRSDHKERNHP